MLDTVFDFETRDYGILLMICLLSIKKTPTKDMRSNVYVKKRPTIRQEKSKEDANRIREYSLERNELGIAKNWKWMRSKR